MKKITAMCLITCAVTISSNSFCMLMRILPTTRTRTPFIPRRTFCWDGRHPTPCIFLDELSKDHSISLEHTITALNSKLTEHNDLLKEHIALTKEQKRIAQKNNLLLRSIIEQNIRLFELTRENIHTYSGKFEARTSAISQDNENNKFIQQLNKEIDRISNAEKA